MFITLFVNDTLFSQPLPSKIKGQFWFGDPNNRKLRKLLEFEGRDGKWLLYSGRAATVSDTTGNPIRYAAIQPFSLYNVKTDAFGSPDKPIMLFAEPDRDECDELIRLRSEPGMDLTVGSQPMNDLFYPAPGVISSHATLTFTGSRWTVVDNGSPAGTYVNGTRISNAFLQTDDVVYIMGLLITIRNGYIEFGNPGNLLQLNEHKFVAENAQKTCYALRSAANAAESDSTDSPAEPTGSMGVSTDPLGWTENGSESFSRMGMSGASPLGMSDALSDDEEDGYEGATTILGMESGTPQPSARKKANPRLVRESNQEVIPLTVLPFTIGKLGCSYCITDNKAISRVHAKIVSDDGQKFYLTDNGSTNKTFLEGKPLVPQIPVLMNNNCKIRFANEHFTFLV